MYIPCLYTVHQRWCLVVHDPCDKWNVTKHKGVTCKNRALVRVMGWWILGEEKFYMVENSIGETGLPPAFILWISLPINPILWISLRANLVGPCDLKLKFSFPLPTNGAFAFIPLCVFETMEGEWVQETRLVAWSHRCDQWASWFMSLGGTRHDWTPSRSRRVCGSFQGGSNLCYLGWGFRCAPQNWWFPVILIYVCSPVFPWSTFAILRKASLDRKKW